MLESNSYASKLLLSGLAYDTESIIHKTHNNHSRKSWKNIEKTIHKSQREVQPAYLTGVWSEVLSFEET